MQMFKLHAKTAGDFFLAVFVCGITSELCCNIFTIHHLFSQLSYTSKLPDFSWSCDVKTSQELVGCHWVISTHASQLWKVKLSFSRKKYEPAYSFPLDKVAVAYYWADEAPEEEVSRWWTCSCCQENLRCEPSFLQVISNGLVRL